MEIPSLRKLQSEEDAYVFQKAGFTEKGKKI